MRLVISKSSVLLSLGVLCATSAYGQGIRRFNSLVATPELVHISAATTVRVIANIEHNPDVIPTGVTLTQVDASGQLIRVIGRMYDDGTNSDLTASDLNFTAQVPIFETSAATLWFRATAAYRGSIVRVQSSLVRIAVAPPSFARAPAQEKLLKDTQGNTVPVNQLVFRLPAGTPSSVANAVASSVGGSIVGFSSSTNLYQLEIPATTVAQLEAAISAVRTNPNVTNVGKNFLVEYQAPIQNDLTRLKAALPANTAAYDRIETIEAFQFLNDLAAPLGPVRVGVIDSGVLGSHAEFTGVALAGDVSDSRGHGTSVAGIIGASNRGAASPQMSGLLAAVPDAASSTGSRPSYAIVARTHQPLHKSLLPSTTWSLLVRVSLT